VSWAEKGRTVVTLLLHGCYTTVTSEGETEIVWIRLKSERGLTIVKGKEKIT
jgi:hypothetical protein